MRLIDADELKRFILGSPNCYIFDAIDAQPTIEERKWIPVSERLPKKVGDYLVTTHSGQIARYIYLGTDSSKEYWMRCTVAWMPLPKPYDKK